MLDKDTAAFNDDRGRSLRTAAEGGRTDPSAAGDPHGTEADRTDERRPVERGPVEHRTSGKRTNAQRLRHQQADRRGGTGEHGTGRQPEEPGEDAPTGAGIPVRSGRPDPEPVIPRQPAPGEVLDDRPGPTAGSTTGEGPDAAPAAPKAPALPAPKGPDGAPALSSWLDAAQVQRLSAQWRAVQTGFVDDPRAAAEQADELVGKAAELLTASVGEHRRRLHGAGDGSGDAGIPTEELRLAMREYRTLLDRLLAA